MIISNTITITRDDKYYAQIKNFCEKNLILPNPDFVKKQRMGFWLGNTPKNIQHYTVDGFNLILPFGIIDTLKGNGWIDKWETDIPEYPDMGWNYDIGLYDYQEECSNAMVKAKHGIFIAPTGAGKTQTFIDIILKNNKKALILTHTQDLMNQAKSRIESLTDIEVGTITDGKVNIKDITVATVQTMCKLDLPSYATTWGTVVTDEIQRISGSPTKQAMFYKVLNNLKCWHKYGCTATFHRGDKQEKVINYLLGDIKHEVPRSTVADKIMKVTIEKAELDTPESDEYCGTDGMIEYAKLINYLCENNVRNLEIAQMLNQNYEHSNLILSDRVAHLKELMSMVERQDLCCIVDGSMTSKKGKEARKQALEDMRNGNKKYLFATFSLAKEGLDIPVLDRLYLTTPHKDKAVIIQSVGRIARTSKEKGEPVCYDFVDANIDFCVNAYKKRKTSYKKIDCTIKE